MPYGITSDTASDREYGVLKKIFSRWTTGKPNPRSLRRYNSTSRYPSCSIHLEYGGDCDRSAKLPFLGAGWTFIPGNRDLSRTHREVIQASQHCFAGFLGD